jgi:glutamate synthase (NADPH/NADH) large chain
MSGLIKKEEFKDNCGFGLIANINGVKSHKVIINSINALISMTHRGGVGILQNHLLLLKITMLR